MNQIPLLLLAFLSLSIVGITTAYAAPCEVGDPFPYIMPHKIGSEIVDPKIDCPADIQAWMNQVNTCAHFAGEPPYDQERADFINAQLKDNKCDQLGCEFDALRTEYEGDIIYFGVIAEYLEMTYGDENSLPECKK